MTEYFFFLRELDPLIGICILMAGMGIVWFSDIEKSPWILFGFFILMMFYIHFGVQM